MTQEQNLPLPILDEALILECIKQNNRQKINNLIEQLSRDQYGYHKPMSMLDLIIKRKYMDALKAYIKRYPVKDWGSQALLGATREGNQAMVELLLKEKADPFSVNPLGWTALHIAAVHGHAHLIEPLVLPLKIPPVDNKNSMSRTWHKGLYQELLEHGGSRGTALADAMQQCYRAATNQFITCYRRIRAVEKPLEIAVAKEAVRQFYATLPGTQAQTYFNVVTKLFEIAGDDPSQHSGKLLPILKRAAADVTNPQEPGVRKRNLKSYFIKHSLEPYIMELYKRPKYAVTFLGGLHNRVGAPSLLHQLQEKSKIFDYQVLRLPLRLAGAPKKSPITSFFLSADTTAKADTTTKADNTYTGCCSCS